MALTKLEGENIMSYGAKLVSPPKKGKKKKVKK